MCCARHGATGDADGEDGKTAEDATGAATTDKAASTETLKDKRAAKKAAFDAQYDEGKSHFDEVKEAQQEQASLNKAEFENEDDEVRVQLEGYRPGLYVRIELHSAPRELVDHFDPKFPLVAGGLLPSEEAMGYINLRFKKHRWHKRILKYAILSLVCDRCAAGCCGVHESWCRGWSSV